MKCQREHRAKKSEIESLMKKIIGELEQNSLIIEEQSVKLPNNTKLNCKVKFENEDTWGTFSIKVFWGHKKDVKDNEKMD